jgi:hypothetical protein
LEEKLVESVRNVEGETKMSLGSSSLSGLRLLLSRRGREPWEVFDGSCFGNASGG